MKEKRKIIPIPLIEIAEEILWFFCYLFNIKAYIFYR